LKNLRKNTGDLQLALEVPKSDGLGVEEEPVESLSSCSALAVVALDVDAQIEAFADLVLVETAGVEEQCKAL
jgi:hypothetical protein